MLVGGVAGGTGGFEFANDMVTGLVKDPFSIG